MRIDAFLKKSQLIKRRTIAHDMVEHGLVLVNGKTVKPSFPLQINQQISITFSNKQYHYLVISLSPCRIEEVVSNN